MQVQARQFKRCQFQPPQHHYPLAVTPQCLCPLPAHKQISRLPSVQQETIPYPLQVSYALPGFVFFCVPMSVWLLSLKKLFGRIEDCISAMLSASSGAAGLSYLPPPSKGLSACRKLQIVVVIDQLAAKGLKARHFAQFVGIQGKNTFLLLFRNVNWRGQNCKRSANASTWIWRWDIWLFMRFLNIWLSHTLPLIVASNGKVDGTQL